MTIFGVLVLRPVSENPVNKFQILVILQVLYSSAYFLFFVPALCYIIGPV